MKNGQICHKNLVAIWICLGHLVSKGTHSDMCPLPPNMMIWNTDHQKFLMSTEYMAILKHISQKDKYTNNQTRPIRYEEKKCSS